MSELAVKITADLYRTRDTMKALYGARWQEEVAPYMAVLKGLHEEKGVPYLDLGQQLSKEMQDHNLNPVMLLAAMVELMEPSAPAGGKK